MATVMSWRSSGGDKGRCDAKCHNAKHPKCVCMCGGRFHGSTNRSGGVKRAVRDYWEDVLTEVEKKASEEGLELETEKWARNRQRILGELQPNPVKKKPAACQYQLPLEVVNV